MKIAEYLPYYKRNLKLAIPVVISQIGQVTVFIADNMMVGHVGTVELAAAAFANNIFTVGMYFGMGLTYGLTPLTGQSFNNLRETAGWLKNGLATHILAGGLIAVLLFCLTFLLPHMGQTTDVSIHARPYYLWLCASFLPFMVFYSFKQFFEGIGNTKIAMGITLTANVINIVINYVLIFGKFGFPELGLAGAGIGTFIARLSMPALYLIFVNFKAKYRHFFLLAWHTKYKLAKILRIVKVGIPIGIQLVVELLAFSFGAIMMGWLGEVPLASHQVALGFISFTYMISLGVASATTIRVSHQLGSNDLKSLKKAVMASTHLVLAFMSSMAIMFILFKNFLPVLFTNDPNVIRTASILLFIAAFFQIFDGLQVVMLGALRGMADVRIPMIFAFVAYILIGIPTSYLLTFVFKAGPQGIWLGFLTGLLSAGLLFYFRFQKNLLKML